MSKPTRKVLFAGIVLALAAVAGGFYVLGPAGEIAVTVAREEGNVEVRVFGVGNVEAQVLSRIGFQIGGRLVALHADQADVVPAGAVLARLDDAAQRAKLAKSEAAISQAAANLAKAQAQRERALTAYQQRKTVNIRRQTLVARGTIAQEAADDAQAAEDMARSDLHIIEAETNVTRVMQDDAAAQRRLDGVVVEQHELRAPFEARVISRHKELGSVVNPGEPVFTLIEPRSVWIRAFVDEARAGGLELGQTAYVRLRSEPHRLVEAEIVRIDQENDRVTEERRVYVRCRQCGPQHPIRFLGERAEVEIVKRVIARGLFVPIKLVEAFDGRSGSVWIVRDGRLAKQRARFGERLLDGRVEIVAGLPGGAAVVTEARSGLREGRAARAVQAGER